MYISYAILAMTVYTIVILKVKCPNFDIIFLMRLLLSIGFGYILYVPVISMLMDVFICTQEAKGFVFFDIDCNTECWDNSHIAYTIMTSFALVQIIPLGMYIRVKF